MVLSKSNSRLITQKLTKVITFSPQLLLGMWRILKQYIVYPGTCFRIPSPFVFLNFIWWRFENGLHGWLALRWSNNAFVVIHHALWIPLDSWLMRWDQRLNLLFFSLRLQLELPFLIAIFSVSLPLVSSFRKLSSFSQWVLWTVYKTVFTSSRAHRSVFLSYSVWLFC